MAPSKPTSGVEAAEELLQQSAPVDQRIDVAKAGKPAPRGVGFSNPVPAPSRKDL